MGKDGSRRRKGNNSFSQFRLEKSRYKATEAALRACKLLLRCFIRSFLKQCAKPQHWDVRWKATLLRALLRCPALSEVGRPGGNKSDVFTLCAKVTGKRCARRGKVCFAFSLCNISVKVGQSSVVACILCSFTRRKPSEQWGANPPGAWHSVGRNGNSEA